ncbi:three-Cys-motif partner protein TcmP [Glycomyces sp. NRRL B-16210]|uniref:three-Cys-motif partner protein TcmP n=1 Tax=Glycomyces sp. NRRL B-16210 TaxID=1463821 RepID=UPI0004C1DED4|nr:three-Cys-motif partner protein TcmP [Glycomyces sp. NRRL B-16210]
MATGTSSGLLDLPQVQSLFKLKILSTYLYPFVSMVGSTSTDGRLVVFDGYAGRGRYPDGTPGSAEHMLRSATKLRGARNVRVVLVEADGKHYKSLAQIAEIYARFVDVRVEHGNAESNLPRVVADAAGLPLFMLLDPTGAVLPFGLLESALSGPRRASRPQTELLINFNADFVRRAAGIVLKEERGAKALHQAELAVDGTARTGSVDPTGGKGNEEKAKQRLTEVCGGDWWEDIAREVLAEQPTRFDLVADRVAQRYAVGLAAAGGMTPVVIPVRRRPDNLPLYYLVFLTRSRYGIWVMADAVGRAREHWVKQLGPTAAEEDGALFAFEQSAEEQIGLDRVHAQERVEANLSDLIARGRKVKLVDVVEEVFGGVFGIATESTVTAALRTLKARGVLNHDKAKRVRDRLIWPV